jgi:uncharacterized protein (DUF1015 family)
LTQIKPFRGIRYNDRLLKNASLLITPPYDVISAEEQEYYYDQNPKNVIRLILGKEFPQDTKKNNRYTRAREFISLWFGEGTLCQEDTDSIYGYTQTFPTPDGTIVTRRGFIALMTLEDWNTRGVFPHEKTFKKPKSDRLNLMRATQSNLCPIFSFFSDPARAISPFLDTLMSARRLFQFTDDDGIEHLLARSDDQQLIQSLVQEMSDKKIYIADGHHRYETALAFRDELEKKGVAQDAHRSVMMYCTPVEDGGIFTLPSHRIISLQHPIDVLSFLNDLSPYAEVDARPAGGDELVSAISALTEKGKGNFFFYPGGDTGYLISIKDFDKINSFFPKSMPDVVRRLDVSILQNVIIEGILGIREPEMSYSKDIFKVREQVTGGEKIAFFINPTTTDEVIRVSGTGIRLPHKSTYFYPKIPSGLVFHKMPE